MNNSRWFVFAAVLLLGLASGLDVRAQDRLSDAGKGLSLEHPEAEQLLLVEGDSKPAGQLIDIAGEDAVQLGERALAFGKAAESVLTETRRQHLFYDAGWRGRMLEACSDVENMQRSLHLVRPPERYAEAFAEVVDGMTRYSIGTGMMEWAISEDQPLYAGAFDQFNAARRGILAGVIELRLEHEREGAEQPALPMDRYTSNQGAAALCTTRYGEAKGAGYDNCMAQQMAALDTITRRFSFTVGLDEATFNTVRHACRREYPDDLVAMDRCETSRADATKP